MMNMVSKDVLDRLVTAGLAQASPAAAWFGTLGDMPDTPVNCVLVTGSGGQGPSRTVDAPTVPSLENARCQVFVRGTGLIASRAKMDTVTAAINSWGKFMQGTTKYESIFQQGETMQFSASDVSEVWTWVANFMVWRRG